MADKVSETEAYLRGLKDGQEDMRMEACMTAGLRACKKCFEPLARAIFSLPIKEKLEHD